MSLPINYSRVRRIKGAIYTFIVLLLLTPFIVLIVLGVRALGYLSIIAENQQDSAVSSAYGSVAEQPPLSIQLPPFPVPPELEPGDYNQPAEEQQGDGNQEQAVVGDDDSPAQGEGTLGAVSIPSEEDFGTTPATESPPDSDNPVEGVTAASPVGIDGQVQGGTGEHIPFGDLDVSIPHTGLPRE